MQETHTDWTLVSLSPLTPAAIVTLAALVVTAAFLVIWSYRGGQRPWALSLVRLLGALLVIGFLTEPAVQIRAIRKIRSRLAVIVDRSRSMGIEVTPTATRYDNLIGAIDRTRTALGELSESHDVEWFDLAGSMSDAALRRPPTGETTDLLAALERARDAGTGRPLAGFVLLSDGADNAGLAGADNAGLAGADGNLSEQALARIARLRAPVNTVDTAAGSRFSDVAVADVVADEFAFVHNTIEIAATITAVGYDSMTAPVTLRRGSDVVATQEAVVRPGAAAQVVFKTKPDQIGEFVYTISVPEFAGEALTHNNTRSFVIQVIRDKIRVLHVAGRPSWDERFLRQHLKQNPNVDLISFFILRTPVDDTSVNDQELSLIRFPVEQLFTKELRTFDVVIFQNFDYRPYGMATFLPNIRDAVRGGLGFMMIGGDQSFSGGGYEGTALDDIVPVEIVGEHFIDIGAVRPNLTGAGERHPVTDLTRAVGSNQQIWQHLPPWNSQNVVLGLKSNATALVTGGGGGGGDGGSGGSGSPLLAVMDVDKGRAMALCTDSIWRWRFSAERDGGSADRAYNRFWSNALRWLVRDPEHARVRVVPRKRHFDRDAEVAISLSVLGRDYQPVPHAQLRVSLEEATQGAIRVDDLVAGADGTVQHDYGVLEPGAYRVRAEAHAGDDPVREGTAVFLVAARATELARSEPRPDLLRAISEASGGEFTNSSEDFWQSLELHDPDVVEIDRRRNIELWDNAWALLIGIALLAADWALRRRSGYL